MVMMLGNHSSGKSTLINSLLGGRDVQATGVAPTDDGFTVIVRGEKDMDEDGPTAVSNPAYGFEGLRGYGHGMFAHFKVKTRKLDDNTSNLPPNLMLIDTPGMIDTPERHSDHARPSERGYDFLNVVKWFATRCDVVLLMFDPSNPGTTGETLDVLTKSLKGLEHKFIIVFNKVDMFEKVPDFARCYGALCWNLSKVIDRKDLPRIYTMFTETNLDPKPSAVMCNDFKDTRVEVLRDILSAPVRRLDNLITELDSAARHLHMCCHIVNVMKSKHLRKKILTYAQLGALVVGVPAGIGAAATTFGMSHLVIAGSAISLSIAAALSTLLVSNLAQHQQVLVNSMDTIFRTEYHVTLQGDEKVDTEDCWTSVKPKIQHVLQNGIKTIGSMRTTSRSNLNSLHDIIKNQVPQLRLMAHELKKTLPLVKT
jgi:ribosome biogenesis GTPase A